MLYKDSHSRMLLLWTTLLSDMGLPINGSVNMETKDSNNLVVTHICYATSKIDECDDSITQLHQRLACITLCYTLCRIKNHVNVLRKIVVITEFDVKEDSSKINESYLSILRFVG